MLNVTGNIGEKQYDGIVSPEDFIKDLGLESYFSPLLEKIGFVEVVSPKKMNQLNAEYDTHAGLHVQNVASYRGRLPNGKLANLNLVYYQNRVIKKIQGIDTYKYLPKVQSIPTRIAFDRREGFMNKLDFMVFLLFKKRIKSPINENPNSVLMYFDNPIKKKQATFDRRKQMFQLQKLVFEDQDIYVKFRAAFIGLNLAFDVDMLKAEMIEMLNGTQSGFNKVRAAYEDKNLALGIVGYAIKENIIKSKKLGATQLVWSGVPLIDGLSTAIAGNQPQNILFGIGKEKWQDFLGEIINREMTKGMQEELEAFKLKSPVPTSGKRSTFKEAEFKKSNDPLELFVLKIRENGVVVFDDNKLYKVKKSGKELIFEVPDGVAWEELLVKELRSDSKLLSSLKALDRHKGS